MDFWRYVFSEEIGQIVFSSFPNNDEHSLCYLFAHPVKLTIYMFGAAI